MGTGMALVRGLWAGVPRLRPLPQGSEEGAGRAVELRQALQEGTAPWTGAGWWTQGF